MNICTSHSQERTRFVRRMALLHSGKDTWNTGTFKTYGGIPFSFLFLFQVRFGHPMRNQTSQFSWKFQTISPIAAKSAVLPSRVLSSLHLSIKFWHILFSPSFEVEPRNSVFSTETLWLWRIILLHSSRREAQPIALFDYAEKRNHFSFSYIIEDSHVIEATKHNLADFGYK